MNFSVEATEDAGSKKNKPVAVLEGKNGRASRKTMCQGFVSQGLLSLTSRCFRGAEDSDSMGTSRTRVVLEVHWKVSSSFLGPDIVDRKIMD